MLQIAAIVFGVAALGGLAMAGVRFATKRNPPAWLAMLHGLLAASGLTLLIYAVCTQPAPLTAVFALGLFVLAAAGGAVLSLVYKWRGRLLPAWLVIAHAILAVSAFALLLVATWNVMQAAP